MEIRLEGRRALVTGGASGIGRATALALADAGANVAVNHLSRDKDTAEAVAEQIRGKGGRALLLPADVSDPAQVEEIFGRMDAAWDGVDILVNSAGIDGERARAWEADPASWRRVIEVNLFGAFYCARQALRRMVPQRRGVILFISSVHQRIAWSGYSAYTASKSGIGLLSQTLAQEAAPFGVRVMSIAPGAIRTPINRNVWDDPDNLKDLLEKIPLGRIGEAREIADMAVVLASDVASYVTGGTCFVDGGMTDYPEFSHGG